MRKHCLYFLICCTVLFAACSPQQAAETVVDPDSSSVSDAAVMRGCGSSYGFDMPDESGKSQGSLEVLNDSARIWIVFDPSDGLQPSDVAITLRGEDTVGMVLPFPPLQYTPEGTYSGSILHSGLPACVRISVAIRAQVPGTMHQATLRPVGSKYLDAYDRIMFCLQPCAGNGGCENESLGTQFRTHTAAQWFSREDSVNGMLQAQFQRIIPEGLTVGCGQTEQLEGWADLEKWLQRAREDAAAALAREVAALELNVHFDRVDPAFSPSQSHLADLMVARGDFEGWTTAGLLEEGHTVLGMCPSNYSNQQMQQVLSAVNGNFAKPGKDNGFLRCR